MIDGLKELVGKTIQEVSDVETNNSNSAMLLLMADGSVFKVWAHGSDDYCQLYVDEYVDPTTREDPHDH